MSKINIIIDNSYAFHQEYAVFSGWSKHGFSSENDQIEFIRGISTKIFYAIDNLPKADKIVFAFDSGSWRKTVDIPGGGYKNKRQDEAGTKKGMDDETAKIFFKLQDEFAKLVKNVGIIASKIHAAEGDDLIYKWVDKLYKAGESCIIISADRDLTQLLRMSDTNWVIQWNNKKNGKNIKNTMYVPENWQQKWLTADNDLSIFNFSVGNEKSTILKLIRTQDITLTTVYPDEVILTKILAGDDGDNVPPVWLAKVPNKKGEISTVRMTGKKPGLVLDALSEKYEMPRKNMMSLWNNPDFMLDCAGLVLRATKDVDGEEERKLVVEAMHRNAELVHLDDSVLPYNLVAEINMHIDKELHEYAPVKHKWNVTSLLENTIYDMSKQIVPVRHDPFASFFDDIFTI